MDRHHVNAYDDPKFRDALAETGRKKLVMAGCTTDVCLAFPAMSAAVDGCDVWEAIDSSGNWDLLTTQMAVLRVAQAGVTCVNWVAVWAELLRDHENPLDADLMRVVGQAYPVPGLVVNSWVYAKGAYPSFKAR